MKLHKHIGSTELVYYAMIIMSTFVIVTSTDHLQTCEEVVQSAKISATSDQGLKWFKWARIFSYCRQYNSAYDHGCSSLGCKDCLGVCFMKDDIRNVTILCERNCSTKACKDGCRFYTKIFVENERENFSLYSNIRKPVVTTTNKINESFRMAGVGLSWLSVFSNDTSKLPSLYLITLRANKDTSNNEYILALTKNTHYSVQIKNMCDQVYSGYHNELDLKFSFTIYPINFFGPTNITNAKDLKINMKSKFIRPLESSIPQNVSVGQPYFEKSGQDTYDHIVWGIDWARLTNITTRVRYSYKISSCTDIQNYIALLQLNPRRHIEVEKGRPAIMKISNTKDDKLATCAITFELRAKQGECFYGEPFTNTIKYGGCKTVNGYTNPCGAVPTLPPARIDTLIYDFNVTIIATECVKDYSDACPDNANITCQFCNTTKYGIEIKWNHPPNVLLINEYTIRWGQMQPPMNMFFDKNNENTEKLSSDTFSFMAKFAINKTTNVGFQVHAETNLSSLTWPFQYKSINKIILKSLEPRPLSPTFATTTSPDKNNSTTVIAVVVVLVLTAGCSIIMFIIYRRRSNIEKRNFHSNEIKMEEQQTAVIADEWELSSSYLTMEEKIGEGAFGNVYCALMKTSELRKTPYATQCNGIKLMGEKAKVAVKFVKDGAHEMEYKDFYEEITLMKDIGYHENIVNMIGCSTSTRPLCLVLEFMNRGDLLHYMREFRKNEMCAGAGVSDNSAEEEEHLSPRDIMSFSWQIACGMEYLGLNNVVHRDLAARNILINDDKKIKISDFGLSRFVSDELIYVSNNKSRKLPVKWMSIEAIYHQEFTTASDVWAYGIVLFEIVTLGGTPYPSIGNRELCKMLKSGYRMDKPENCEDTVYDIMLHCWNEIPTQRPTFTELREHLEGLVEKGEMYFSFDIDENDTYYNFASFKSIPSDADDDGDDVFSKDFAEKPIQIKPLNRSRDSSIQSRNSSLKSRASGKNDELKVDINSNRYVSPQSINVFKDGKNLSPFDNQGFDEDGEKS